MVQNISRRPLPLVVVLAAAAGGSSNGASAAGGRPSATVTAQNTAFSPSTLTVPANTPVTIALSNKDSIEHSLTFNNTGKSVDADGGSTQMLTFMSPGAGTTMAFHCKYHPMQMQGTITVTGSGGATPGSSPPSSSSSGY